MSSTTTVAVVQVRSGERRRKLDRQKVKGLADSIGEIGLLNPITVRAFGDGYQLVAGRHRLEAARLLDWPTIPAVIVELDDVDRMLAEIDENLIRNDLSDLERSEHLAERKRLYLLKHPETKRGAQGGGRDGHGTRVRTENETVSFSVDTAEKTGRTERAVQQDVQIAESIPEDVRDALRETPVADSKTDLLAMARLPEEAQREIVETTDVNDKAAMRQAISERRQTPKHAPDPAVGDDYVEDFNQDIAGDESAPDHPDVVDNGASPEPWEDEIMAAQEAAARETDEPTTIEAAGPDLTEDMAVADATNDQAPPSDSRSGHQPSGRNSSSTGLGSKPVPSTRVFTPRGLDAGDLSRLLLDLDGAIEAIAENATAAQKQLLRERLGGTVQPAPAPAARPDLRAVLADGWTVSELADAITATRTVQERQALQALLLTGRPIEEIRGINRLTDTMIRRHNDTVQREAIVAGVH